MKKGKGLSNMTKELATKISKFKEKFFQSSNESGLNIETFNNILNPKQSFVSHGKSRFKQNTEDSLLGKKSPRDSKEDKEETNLMQKNTSNEQNEQETYKVLQKMQKNESKFVKKIFSKTDKYTGLLNKQGDKFETKTAELEISRLHGGFLQIAGLKESLKGDELEDLKSQACDDQELWWVWGLTKSHFFKIPNSGGKIIKTVPISLNQRMFLTGLDSTNVRGENDITTQKMICSFVKKFTAQSLLLEKFDNKDLSYEEIKKLILNSESSFDNKLILDEIYKNPELIKHTMFGLQIQQNVAKAVTTIVDIVFQLNDNFLLAHKVSDDDLNLVQKSMKQKYFITKATKLYEVLNNEDAEKFVKDTFLIDPKTNTNLVTTTLQMAKELRALGINFLLDPSFTEALLEFYNVISKLSPLDVGIAMEEAGFKESLNNLYECANTVDASARFKIVEYIVDGFNKL